eukprot:scaffold2282_cov300-Chaetoceros_neogracile.AAC.3
MDDATKHNNNESSADPILSSDDVTDSFVVTAGLDGSIHKFKISTSEIQNVGYHYLPDKITNANTNADDCACSCIKALSNHYVALARWDSIFYIWDTKNLNNAPVAKKQLPDKAFSIDAIPLRDSNKHHQQHQQEQQKDHHQHSMHNNTESYRIAISTAGKRLVIIDVNELNTPTPTATITLYQSRFIA